MRSRFGGVALFASLVSAALAAGPQQPAKTGTPAALALHPANPHYFQWRGRPTILITSGEHYGAVLNLDFDYRRYLDTLAADGLNYTRVFSGAYVEPQGAFNIARNTLAPAAGRFIAPWPRSTQPGYANGGNKFDLSRWDDAYFARLKDFLTYAGTRNIVVELTLFCPMYEDLQWTLSPMRAANNVNGIGEVPRADVYTMGNYGGLLALQESLTRKLVTELNGFDNLFFEICNEPYAGPVQLAWQHRIADVIVETERDLPVKHLIAQNIANNTARITAPHPGVSIFNFHYATPPDAVGENYALAKVIGDDETGFRGIRDQTYRTEGWDFVIAGGALYNNLDYSFAVGHEDGSFVYPDTQPGGGSAALRRQLRVLKDFIEGFDFVRMSPNMSAIKGGVPRSGTARALVEPNRAMAIYVRKESPTGPWSARWTGILTAPVSGEYVFHTFSNDGVRLWIDDTQLIDNWTDHTETEDVGRIVLSAGTTHRVRLEYFYNGGQGATKLWWTLPDGAGKGVKQPVPASALQHSGPQGGAGLRGEYFKGNDLKNAWAERSDAQIDFVWGTTAPISAASSDAPALQVELAEGNWQADWVDPSTGKIVLTTRVDGGGVRAINPPSYETDIALRLRLAAPDQRRPPKGGH